MGMFDKFNGGQKWEKNTEGFEYIKLREYLDVNGWDKSIRVYGYYINHLENGDACTIISENCFINLPSHAVAKFNAFGPEENEVVNCGGLYLKDFEEITTKKFKNKTIVFKFADEE